MGILAAGNGKFLVIERDGQTGEKAAFKRIMAIDIKDATDTTHVDKFPHKAVPKGVQPVKKTTFIDLLDPKFGLAGEKLPEKMEGLAWGPALPDGRDLLVGLRRQRFQTPRAEPVLRLRRPPLGRGHGEVVA